MASHIFDPPAGVPDIPDRFQTMSIASKGDATLPRDKRERASRGDLSVADIAGAQPKLSLAARELVNRPSFHDPADIHGSAPSTLHPSLNKPSYVCRNDDIEGSVPAPKTFSTTRAVDPLMPSYKLPSAPKPVTEAPKFVRDSFDVSDIPGTKLTPKKVEVRDSFNVSDIPGTHPAWKPLHKEMLSGEARDIMRVDDISKQQFKTTRVTDPLKPTHVINGMVISDDDPGMRVREQPKGRGGPTLSLTTADIEGANSGYVSKEKYPGGLSEDKRRQFRNTNHLGDIDGAASGTLKRAIRTNRVTDPNTREYPSLDGVVHEVPVRLAHPPPQDPRDIEISRLRAEVESLRKDATIRSLEAELRSLRGSGTAGSGAGGGESSRPPRPASTAPWDREEVAVRGHRSGLRSSASSVSLGQRDTLRSSASASVLSGRSTATPLPPSASGAATPSSNNRRAGSEVLRIMSPAPQRGGGSGGSRVPDRDAASDRRAVADLPETLPSTGLSRAGSASLRL